MGRYGTEIANGKFKIFTLLYVHVQKISDPANPPKKKTQHSTVRQLEQLIDEYIMK